MRSELDAASVAALSKSGIYLVHAVEFEFDSGTERFTDAHADITFGGNSYTASGNLVSFGAIKETTALEIGSMTFTMSAVNQIAIALALGETFTNRKINLYRGYMDPDTYLLISDPTLVYEGRISSFEVTESPGATATLKWNTKSVLEDFNKTAGRRTNYQDQEAYLAWIGQVGVVDLGFEFAHKVNKDIKWGRE